MDYNNKSNGNARRLNLTPQEKNMTNTPSKGTALITGASRGIGAVYADRLAKRGYDLILVARSEAPLKDVTARLSSATGRRVVPIAADLNDPAHLAQPETNLKDPPPTPTLSTHPTPASL